MILNLITKAKDLFYNNTTSGLTATNTQAAIDEVVTNVGKTVKGNITTFNSPRFSGTVLYCYNQTTKIWEISLNVDVIAGSTNGWVTICTLPFSTTQNVNNRVSLVSTSATYSGLVVTGGNVNIFIDTTSNGNVKANMMGFLA